MLSRPSHEQPSSEVKPARPSHVDTISRLEREVASRFSDKEHNRIAGLKDANSEFILAADPTSKSAADGFGKKRKAADKTGLHPQVTVSNSESLLGRMPDATRGSLENLAAPEHSYRLLKTIHSFQQARIAASRARI